MLGSQFVSIHRSQTGLLRPYVIVVHARRPGLFTVTDSAIAYCCCCAGTPARDPAYCACMRAPRLVDASLALLTVGDLKSIGAAAAIGRQCAIVNAEASIELLTVALRCDSGSEYRAASSSGASCVVRHCDSSLFHYRHLRAAYRLARIQCTYLAYTCDRHCGILCKFLRK